MSRRLIVSHFFPPTLGGIADVVQSMALADPANTVVVTPPVEGRASFDAQQPYTIIRRTLFQPGQVPSWRSVGKLLATIIEEHRIEVVVFAHYAPYAFFGPALKRKFGIRWGVYTHGLDAFAYTTAFGRRQLLRRALRAADFVIANSDWTRQQLSHVVSPWRVQVIHPGVALPGAVTSTPSTHKLLSIGRLTPIKGYDVAIQAVALLQKEFPDVHYTIIGKGDQRSSLEQLVHEQGLENHVHFAGAQLPYSAPWHQAFEQSSIVLQPSRSFLKSHYVQAESFGLLAAQAGAHGRAVIGSSVGGTGEVIQTGVTGTLVPPDDPSAIAKAVANYWRQPTQLGQHARNAADRVREFFSDQVFTEAFNASVTASARFPKISVCIPVWNSAKTIRPTLDSLLSQDYPNLELIVADDGSTDQTVAIVRTYPQVRVVQGEHGGAGQARNLAAAAATGDYIYFSDADCIHRPDALRTLWRALQNHPQAAFAYSSFRLGWKSFRLRPFSVSALREQNYISTRALIRRRNFLGYDPSVKRLQDWDLWLRSAMQGQQGIWVDEHLYSSIVQARTMSSGWFPKFLYRWPMIADRLSRGAGMSLREAEAIIRQKHGLHSSVTTPWPDFVCPLDKTTLRVAGDALECPQCQTHFSQHHDIPELLHPQLMDEYKRTEIHAHTDVLAWRAGHITVRNSYYHRQAKAPLQKVSGDRVILEVAAGERPDSFEIVQAGHRAIITDIAEDRMARAKQSAELLNLGDRVRFAVADGEHLPLPSESVDGVITAASFHHFPVPPRALREFSRVTKPGGLIVLELEPQRWPYTTVFRWLRPVRSLLRRREAAGHVHSVGDDQTEGFTQAQLQALARDAGLEIVELYRVKIVTEFADQASRLAGKLFHKNWESPKYLRTVSNAFDQLLLRVPVVRRLAWHWNVIFRRP